MGTRSNIAIKRFNGAFESVYCYWDGYPEHNGAILHNHYNNPEIVEELIELGCVAGISSLYENVAPTESNTKELGEHTFESPHPKTTIFYGRDDGQEPFEPMAQKDMEEYMEFLSDSWFEWGYYYDELEGAWYCLNLYSGSPQEWKLLKDVLKELEEE